ncbi:MAG TPA: dihydropteroate synthase [Nitrospirota bacterium]|nr:dihydropteroate synthase [Nitrospirota bacterium]
MEPVLRISGRGAITLTLKGLTSGQATALRKFIRSSNSGTSIICDPLSVVDRSESSPGLALTGTPDQLKRFLRAFGAHDDASGNLSQKMDSLLDNYLRSDYKITCRGRILELGSRTHVMGILNVTPDSFSDGGLYANEERAFAHAREMATAGADIIDIGGESTRPGAEPISEEEELRRIVPIIGRMATELMVPVSVDTYKSSVARRALEAGASIVNDISGLRFSPDMARIAADYGAAVVIMHIKGTPRDMQQNPVYDDVVVEVMSFLAEGIEIALKAGVEREKILIDPGIGFGKTLEHNLTLLDRLDEFRSLGRPIVLGTSRKKFIGTIIGIPVPDQRDDGTAATIAFGIERGASVVRVHDVARMVRVARMTDAVLRKGS